MKFPSFLRPEVFPYASVEIIPADRLTARLTDSAPPVPVMDYRLYVRQASGVEQLLSFTTASSRGLALIALVKQPVDLRTEDVPADLDAHDGPACGPSCFHPYLTDDDDREELSGSTCGAACGYCGRCS